MPTAYRYMLDTVVGNVSFCKTFSLILDICTLVKLVKFIYFALSFLCYLLLFLIATLW